MDTVVQSLLVLERARSLAAIGTVLRGVGAPLGYDRTLMFATGTDLDRGAQRLYWIDGDWFGEGASSGVAQYLHACPVNRHVLDSDAPFFWSKQQGVRGERYQVVRQPRGEGLHGLQVPVFGATGLEGAVSWGGRTIDASPSARLLLELIGTAAFRMAHRLSVAPAVVPAGTLSAREREVLRWVAAGRRQADIAATLGLSTRWKTTCAEHASGWAWRPRRRQCARQAGAVRSGTEPRRGTSGYCGRMLNRPGACARLQKARMMLMKLQLASMAALMLAVGSVVPASSHAAGSPGSTTDCVPVRLGPNLVHQRCTVTRTLADGTVFTSVYWIDQNGQWYLPAD